MSILQRQKPHSKRVSKTCKTTENGQSAPKFSHCNNPGHKELYFGANLENRPPKWTLTETQQKLTEEYKKPVNPRNSNF